MRKIIYILLTLLFISNVKAENTDLVLNAKSAILIEPTTGKVLYETNSKEKLPPASMTKIASMLIIMEQIDKGNLKFSDEVEISENAANMGGSQIFLSPKEKYTVENLLKGVAIASGNDAVVALAEKVAGTESAFVKLMNKKAKKIGAYDTNFVNAHGLDNESHYSTAYDMSLFAKELLKHKKILEFTKIYEEYLDKNDGTKIWLVNTNKLIKYYEGADGLKTGFTKNAGYCLTATAKKNDFRLISVVMGEENPEKRSSDTVNLLNYGFNTYKLNTIKKNNEKLGKVRIEKGKTYYSDVTLIDDATELIKINNKKENYKFKVSINKKIEAPIKRGEKIGTAKIIDKDNNLIDEVNVTVEKDILKANVLDYLKRNIIIILRGKTLIKNN